MATKVLLVDDERGITTNLSQYLQRAGYETATAADGVEAMDQVDAFKPDMIILDILMPRMDGRELLRRLRRNGNWTPVILLTQVDAASERAMALDEGADDYINKPFNPTELLARVRAVLRRVQAGLPSLSSARHLASGDIALDRRSGRVTLAGRPLDLTPRGYELLEYFFTHPDELLSREQILNTLWGWTYSDDTRAIDIRIAELRRALQDDPANPRYIETVPGKGYRFIARVEVNK